MSNVTGRENALVVSVSGGCKSCDDEKVSPKEDWPKSVAAVGLCPESVGDAAREEAVSVSESLRMEWSSFSMDCCWLVWRSMILVRSWWFDSWLRWFDSWLLF